MSVDAVPDLGFDLELEPERYELRPSGDTFDLDLNRRDFLRVLSGGLLVLCLETEGSAQESGRGRRSGQGGQLPRQIEAWVHIAEDGSVTACSGKAEVGQNARTSLTMAVADELSLPVERVHLVLGDTDSVPYDMGTFGSRTTPTMVPQMRRAAAAARGVLLGLAAERFSVDRGSLGLADGKVVHAGTGKSAGYGELTRGRKLVETISDRTPIAPPVDWKVAGRSVPKVAGRDFVTGKHRYSTDIERPGMARGKVLRAPAFGVKLVSLDASRAEALPDVKVVRDGDFVGVVAPNEAIAARALAALRPTWTSPERAMPSDKDLAAYFKEHPESGSRSGPGNRSRNENGSVADDLAASPIKVEAAYTVAYIAHAPLEPRAAVAEWDGGKLTVWTGTQRPFGVRSELAQAFKLPEGQVRVIVPDTGSGYGGKHTGEAALEAARLAKAAGRPVKLIWTREEEFTWAYFRPGGLIEVAAGIDRDGRLTAWEFHNYNSGASGIASPYKASSSKVVYHATSSPLRQGSYRALAATANHFARESHMDELAHAAGIDPLAFRLRNLDDSRHKAVLEDAASRFGWGKLKPGAGRGFGLAVGSEKGGHVATCAEVAVEPGTGAVKVVRAVTVFECGAVVNPDHLRNQVEGAVIQGLGGALFEGIRFRDGKILNPRFSRYRVPRFSDIPQVEVALIDRKDLPAAGGGETPIVAIAPALANAIFSASGVRLRSMPLAPKGTIKT